MHSMGQGADRCPRMGMLKPLIGRALHDNPAEHPSLRFTVFNPLVLVVVLPFENICR